MSICVTHRSCLIGSFIQKTWKKERRRKEVKGSGKGKKEEEARKRERVSHGVAVGLV